MLQMYPDYTTGVPLRGHPSPSRPNYRGRGIGSPQNNRGGYDSPRSRGRGRGFGKNPSRDAPLSALLGRPYLQPIVFVRSVHTATLFEHREDDELMKPLVEDVGDAEQEHVPTAERVARVFSGSFPNAIDSADVSDEALEEYDFSEIGRLQAEVDAAVASGSLPSRTPVEDVEEKFTGIWIERPQALVEVPATMHSDMVEESTTITTTTEDAITTTIAAEISVASSPAQEPLFFVDTAPAEVAAADAPSIGAEQSLSNILERHIVPAVADDDDDEVIVYVVPHPRTASGRPRTPSPPRPVPILDTTAVSVLTGQILEPPPFSSISFSAFPTTPASGSGPSPRKALPTAALTPHGRNKSKLKARALGKRADRRTAGFYSAGFGFGARGAVLAEARLRGDDPRKDQRRKGDSDIDWGDSDDEEAEEETGMQVDEDLDAGALVRFAKGLLGNEGGKWVTMDDVEDEKRMREEDEEEDVVRGESGEDTEDSDVDEEELELNAVLDAEEAVMVGESDDEDEEEDSDDDLDVEQSPNSAFQTRLDRLRKASQEQKLAADDSMDQMLWDDEDSDDGDILERTWRDRDEDFAGQIQAILDENGDILSSTSRRGRKALLKAAVHGDFDDDFDFDFDDFAQPAKRGKKKRADIPPELQDIWDLDRAKKSENKKRRQLARLEAAADPLAAHKGGKKGRKAMLAAARLDPTIHVIPNRVIDMTTLVVQIRRFIDNLAGPNSMSLPPTDKATRKNVHEMALAFGLKSVSKGKGTARYTTLTKTTKTGLMIDEKKVARICRRGDARGSGFVHMEERDKGKGRAAGMPRHRDGDEVGKAAPKIGESNIGFKMLASMGWSEGQRIGVSADGLHVPLTAVIKNTKLGLGATR
ncbi:hypothetical protein MKEN_01214400 [Mycena kentingensis (nom. inval.)]|nr:hypothetical protein MKEN_01214400 [Mycena kentingensis (nom. inval.)]